MKRACFERALALDPGLAIARWGIAYAVGPNYNKAWEAFDPVDLADSLARARDELDQARRGRASTLELQLIDALSARFPTDDPAAPRGWAEHNHQWAVARYLATVERSRPR